jgi:O-antigen/teichoic acid export membrane protein
MGGGETNNPLMSATVASAPEGEGVRLDYASGADPASRLEPEPLTYGEVSLHGAFWTIAFAVVNKVVAFASQVALTWFLLPGTLGVVALALAISGVSAVLTTSGLIGVLVQRQRPIDDDAPQVFWLSLVMGIGAMVLTAACTPLAAKFLNNWEVVPVVLVITLCFPSSALGTIYQAKLLRDLKFKEVAAIYSMMSFGKAVASVAMAAAGFGPYAIVVPLLASQAGTSLMFRRAAGRMPIGRPQPWLWGALLLPTLWLTAYGVANALQMYGTNFVVGRYRSTEVVGLYYWGFTLSAQTMFLLAMGLRDVLFPTLAKLNDQPERQAEGFRTAIRLMTLVTVPVCVVQAVTADALIKLLFRETWEPVIPVVQYLSFAMLTQPMQVLAFALLMALGRFRMLTLVAAVQGALLVATSIVGAKAGAERAISIWSGAGLFAGGILAGYVAFRQLGQGWAALVASFQRTIVPAVASGMLAWGAALWLRPYSRIAEVVAASVVLGVVYLLLACVFAREDMAQLLVRLRMTRLAARLVPQAAKGQ